MKNLIWTKRFGRGFFMGPILAGLLAGCGGSSAPVTTTPPPPPPPSFGFEEMSDAQAVMISDYFPFQFTPLVSGPTFGSAVYDGYLGGDLSDSTAEEAPTTGQIIGELSLDVTFGNSFTVSGRGTNFFDEDGASMPGDIDFLNGTLDSDQTNGGTLSVIGNGTLTDADGNILEFGTRLEGDFLGADYDAVGGFVYATVTDAGESDQYLTGAFIAER